ncbi:MAG: hypothetical protein OSJ27_04030 [Candidatus Gastranaerophilales bacterium]|nr:hypothetical protein [Candidatus Gastranaerophilales bacterium]
MRISGISPNFNQNRNVNFGRFADDNAKNVVREALTAEADESYMQPVYNAWFKRIDKDKNFIVYTSENDTVKGKFDDEFVRRNSDNKYLMLRIELLKRGGTLEDLSKFNNVKEVASDLEDINDVINGINVADKHRSKDPYGDATAKEAERQARIDNLAD